MQEVDVSADCGTSAHITDLNPQLAKSRIDRFPRTRYYGSKRRLLHWIYNSLKDVPFKTVLDGFGGTASVSLLFKAMGKDVTFNDALLSNCISAKALLANAIPFAETNQVQSFFNSIKPKHGFIAKTFSGKFYLDEENEWLDGAVEAIECIELEGQKAALYYALFQACLQKRPFNLFHRANLSLRINGDGQQSFGNQTTWDTPFPDLAYRAYLDLVKSIWESNAEITILSPSDVSEIQSGYDLVYLDPPYISLSNSGDDYLRRYHFLEGLCRYFQWPNLIDGSYKNLQFKKQAHIAEWNAKRHFKNRLFSLIERHRHSTVVLSYIDGAYPSLTELRNYFQEVFSKVRIEGQVLPHALSKGVKNELLIIGMPS